MDRIQVRGPWEPVTILARQRVRRLRLPWDGGESTPRHEKGGPVLNLYESSEEFLITVELPGLKPEEVELEVTDDALTLSCLRTQKADAMEEAFRRQERWVGRWSRRVVLSRVIDPAGVTAEMDKGVLHVRLRKSVHPQPRRVPVTCPRQEPSGG